MQSATKIDVSTNWNAPVALILIALMVLLLPLIGGCSSDPEPTLLIPEERGERGESCVARNDCEEGLACVSGRCVENEYNISLEAGHCATVECLNDDECCGDVEPPSFIGASCDELDSDCAAGNTTACNDYNEYCACDYQCENDRCVPTEPEGCSIDADCPPGQECEDSQCVECVIDDDCSGDDLCIRGFCDEGCDVDSNCPLFHLCQANECVHTGCSTDRECVFFTEHHRATCEDSSCLVPCENDAECNQGQFDEFQVCEGGNCVFVGCETDDECRAAMDMADQPDYWRAVCETD